MKLSTIAEYLNIVTLIFLVVINNFQRHVKLSELGKKWSELVGLSWLWSELTIYPLYEYQI